MPRKKPSNDETLAAMRKGELKRAEDARRAAMKRSRDSEQVQTNFKKGK